MPTPIGIDLGTTFSLIACYRDGRVEIISDSYERGLIPSMVYFDPETGEVSVGHMAYEKSTRCPSNFIKDVKRIIGRKLEDSMIKKLFQPIDPSFQLTEAENGTAAYKVEIKGKTEIKKPEDISAEVLKYLVQIGSDYLGEEIEEAVISVPAYFSGAQRKATLKAAQLAGLRVKRLISEPVAAALCYTTDKQVKEKILVFDFGGGTLDVSLIQVTDQLFEVKAVSGDTMLGGKNIDENLIKHFYVPAKKCVEKRRILRNLRRLEQNCTALKEYLSKTNSHEKVIDGYDGDTDLTLSMNRKEFNELNKDIFQRTLDIVKYCLRSANWTKEDIQRVVLVGGSTRIPKIREILQDFFGNIKIKTDLNPDEAVARGACLQAAILSKEFICLEQYNTHEVNCLSLGISGYGNLTTFVIPRNSKLPTSGSVKMISTSNDQKRVPFTITEGERKNSQYNNKLGYFTLDGLPPRAAGDVSLTIDFSLDEDGILTVKATESSTGQSNSLVVTMGEFRLSDHEINYNIEQSKKQKEEDDLFEEFVTRRNATILQCQKWIYFNYNAYVRKICKDFIKYAESLNFEQIHILNNKFDELETQLYGFMPSLVSSLKD